MKRVNAAHKNVMQMKPSVAPYYCCSNAWPFLCHGNLEESNFSGFNFRSNNE